jgi:hypothetical protein
MQKLDMIKKVKFQSLSPAFFPRPPSSAFSRGKNMDSGARNANIRRRTRRSRPAIFRLDRVDVVVTPESRLHPEAFTSAPSSSIDPLSSQSRSASSRCARRRALSFASLPRALLASDERDSGRMKRAKRTKALLSVAAT